VSIDDDALAVALERLHRLEAAQSAQALVNEYAVAVDGRTLEPVLALFAPDAVLHSPRGIHTGIEQIAQSFADGWAMEPSRKRHFVTNTRAVVQPDGTVTATAYFFYVGRDAARSVIGWGSYDDRIDVSGERPVFLTKKITLLMSTDLDTGWQLTDQVP
jgi:ketosteroid isomerase-like protein